MHFACFSPKQYPGLKSTTLSPNLGLRQKNQTQNRRRYKRKYQTGVATTVLSDR
jgi:hypothetical protein